MSDIPMMNDITYELIYQRFLINNEKLRKHLTDLTVEQYMALHIIAGKNPADPVYAGRTYLNDLSVSLKMSIHRTSKIVAALRDKGLITWSHDGDGADGTYALITPEGRIFIDNQEKNLKDYYERVIRKFGRGNIIKLLQMMKELETVLNSELEETEETEDDQ